MNANGSTENSVLVNSSFYDTPFSYRVGIPYNIYNTYVNNYSESTKHYNGFSDANQYDGETIDKEKATSIDFYKNLNYNFDNTQEYYWSLDDKGYPTIVSKIVQYTDEAKHTQNLAKTKLVKTYYKNHKKYSQIVYSLLDKFEKNNAISIKNFQMLTNKEIEDRAKKLIDTIKCKNTIELNKVIELNTAQCGEMEDEFMIGQIIDFIGKQSDINENLWRVCNGQSLNISEYLELYKIIGTKYGEGDKEGTFKIPDFRGRFTVAAGEYIAKGDDPKQNVSYEVGDRGGENFHKLQPSEQGLIRLDVKYGQYGSNGSKRLGAWQLGLNGEYISLYGVQNESNTSITKNLNGEDTNHHENRPLYVALTKLIRVK